MRCLLFLPLLICFCGAADLKLGLLLPLNTLSGSEIATGKLVALAGLLAVEHVNRRDFGLLSSIDEFDVTPNITLFLGDTFSDVGRAVQRVLDWTQVEKAHAVVGPSSSSVAVPVSYVADAFSLPLLSHAATSASLSSHRFFSRVVPTDATYASALAKLVQSFGWKNVGILYVDSEFGAGILRDFGAAAGILNIKTDAAVRFEPGNLDSLAAAMRFLRNAIVRTVVVVAHESSLEEIARTADTAGLIGDGVTWLLGNPNVEPTTVADLRGSQELNRMFSGWIGLLRSNRTQTFSTLLGRLKPTEVDFESVPISEEELSQMPRMGACPTCGFAYDAVWTLAFAAARLRHVDFTDGAALNQAIRQVRFKGVSGYVALDPETGDPLAEERLFHVVNWAIEHDGGTERLGRKTIAQLDVSHGLQVKDESGPHWSDGSIGWTAPEDWQCGTGSIFNHNNRTCEVCPAGSFANKDTDACQLCGLGSVAGEGFGSCTPCRQGYADEVGMEHCKDCPENTVQPAGSSGVSVIECTCKAGFYLTHGLRRGQACAPCPSGAECPGGTEMPFPQYGYWADTSCKQHGGGEECEAWDSFLQCVPATDCLGGRGAPCSDGLAGRMCKETTPGWFNIGSSWRISCDNGGRVWSILAMLATGLAWFGINYVGSGEYDAMDIALLYVQVTGIVSSFGLRWHPSLGILNTCLSIANFDTDFVTPHCLTDWGPLSSFYLQLTLPFIWALAFVLWRCIYALYRWIVRGERQSVRYVLRDVRDPVITSTISLLIVVYHSICLKCFQAFSCTRFPNGRLYLSSAPQVECWTGHHWLMVALATIYIPAFVIGLPVAVVVLIRAKEKQAQLNTASFHSVWGRLYSRYDPGWKWWEAMLLLRRLLLSLIAVFVAPPMLQSALAVSVLSGLLTLHAYARPYTSDAIDMLEVFTLWGSMLYALFGLLFYPSISPSSQGYVCPDDEHACGEDSTIKAGIARLLLAWTIATMVLAAWVSLFSIRETSMSKKASAILHGTCKSAQAPSGSLAKNLRTAFRRVYMMAGSDRDDSSLGGKSPGFRVFSLNSSSLNSSAMGCGFSSKVPLQLDSILKGGQLLKWVSSDQPQADFEAAAKAFQEIQGQLGRLCEDDVGPNAVSWRAEAFRQLNGFPGLIDFLASFATTAQCDSLGSLLDSYSTFLSTSKGAFPFSSLVIPEFRTSLIHSLLVCGSRNRRNFSLICRQIQLSTGTKISESGDVTADAEGGIDAFQIANGGIEGSATPVANTARQKPVVVRHARSHLVQQCDSDDSISSAPRSSSAGTSPSNCLAIGVFDAMWSPSSPRNGSTIHTLREATEEEEQHASARQSEERVEQDPDHDAANRSPPSAPVRAEDLATPPCTIAEQVQMSGSMIEKEDAGSYEKQVPVCWGEAQESPAGGHELRQLEVVRGQGTAVALSNRLSA